MKNVVKLDPNFILFGDISVCSYVTKGVFLDIISDYMARSCKMSEIFLLKRFPENKKEIDELREMDIIKFKDGNVQIDYIDQQDKYKAYKSKIYREAGKKGAEKRWGKKE